MRSRVRIVVVSALAYLVAAKLGLAYATVPGGASLVWPASGVLIALALVRGRAVVVGLAVGSLVSGVVSSHFSPAVAAIAAIGNSLECLLALELLAWARIDRRLPTVRDVVGFAVLGAAVPCAASALFGGAALWYGGIATSFASTVEIARSWYVGNVLGVIAFAPVLLVSLAPDRRRWARADAVEAAVVSGVVAVGVIEVFLTSSPAWLQQGLMVFAALLLSGVVWLAVRFGQRIAAVAVLAVAAGAAVGTALERGAFASVPEAQRVWLLQLYLLVFAIACTAIAALVADRLRQQADLLRNQTLLERTSQVASVAGFSWSAETGPLWSPGMFAVLGTRPLVPADFLAHVAEEDRARCRSVMIEARADRAPIETSFVFVRPGGERRHIHVRIEPTVTTDGHVRWDGAIQDVTERVATHEQLRQMSDAIERSQRIQGLGRLVGSLVHDFNNLLTGILLNVSVARARGPSRDEPLDEIEAAATRAAALCRRTLELVRGGKSRVQPIDLSAVVGDVVVAIRGSLRPDAELVLELAEELPRVDGDPVLLGQVAMNLLTNASDALGPRGGRILVRTERRTYRAGELRAAIVPSTLAEREVVVLTVEDDGGGIAPEVLARIFEPLFSTKDAGHGLGLSVAISIVEAHGGTVLVDSEVGRGSRFSLLLPCQGASADRGRATAVLIEPDTNVLRVVTQLLEDEGFDVHATSAPLAPLAGAAAASIVLVDAGAAPRLELEDVRRVYADAPLIVMAREAAALPRLPDDATVLPKPFGRDGLREAIRLAREAHARRAAAAFDR